MYFSSCFSATGKVNGMTGKTKGGKKERNCQVSFILMKQLEEMHMHAGKAKHI